MADNRIIDDLGFNFEDNAEVTQESYNANNSGFSDLFQDEETPDIALGYKKNDKPLEPARPGRFF